MPIIFKELPCPEQDSNLHVVKHTHLKRARLPIPPPGHNREKLWNLIWNVNERQTRLELATPTLARSCSTNWAIAAIKHLLTLKIDDCRGDRIRTCGRLVPNQERYRAALHPVAILKWKKSFPNCECKGTISFLLCKVFHSFFSKMRYFFIEKTRLTIRQNNGLSA